MKRQEQRELKAQELEKLNAEAQQSLRELRSAFAKVYGIPELAGGLQKTQHPGTAQESLQKTVTVSTLELHAAALQLHSRFGGVLNDWLDALRDEIRTNEMIDTVREAIHAVAEKKLRRAI